MAKRWLVVLVIVTVVLTGLAFVVPALSSGEPTVALPGNTLAQDNVGYSNIVKVDPASVELLSPTGSQLNGDDGTELSLPPVPHSLAFDTFLKIDGMPGESIDQQHYGPFTAIWLG